MANSHQTSVEVALPPERAEAALYQAFLHAGLTSVSGGAGEMRGTVPTSMSSWGERVVATIAFGQHGATVRLRSESLLPTTLIDFGRNRKNVEKVLAALRPLAPLV